MVRTTALDPCPPRFAPRCWTRCKCPTWPVFVKVHHTVSYCFILFHSVSYCFILFRSVSFCFILFHTVSYCFILFRSNLSRVDFLCVKSDLSNLCLLFLIQWDSFNLRFSIFASPHLYCSKPRFPCAMTVSIPSAGDRLLRLMMPPPGGSSGSVGGLLWGDVQFSMSLRVGKKVTRKVKKKITKRGTRIGEKTGFWLHTSMVPLDGSSVVFHKEDLDLVFKKKCPVFNEKCCVTLCMSPIDRKTQLQIMNEVTQHTRDTQEKQRKERLEREHRQSHKKQRLQSHKNFFSHNSATVDGGGGGASSRTTNVHTDGAAATVAKALPRRMSFSQLKFKHVLLQKKQKRSSFSQLTLHQLTEREGEMEEEEGEEEEDVPHARPTDFHPQSDLIQRAKLLPLPSSPETQWHS